MNFQVSASEASEQEPYSRRVRVKHALGGSRLKIGRIVEDEIDAVRDSSKVSIAEQYGLLQVPYEPKGSATGDEKQGSDEVRKQTLSSGARALDL